MRRLLPLIILAACATPAVVTTTGTLDPQRYAVAGDTPAAAEVRRQLIAMRLHAPDAASVIRVGYAAAPRAIGVCAGAATPCPEWLDAPDAGYRPFAPPLRWRLTLVTERGSVTVTQPGRASRDPLPALVATALSRLPAPPA